ncbi:MAG: hypothetical protein HYW50_00640 [Candidatus Diapherotrites archaeon]|nr:hypothetical protein [Candidatus Diapherotrites archaeon]
MASNRPKKQTGNAIKPRPRLSSKLLLKQLIIEQIRSGVRDPKNIAAKTGATVHYVFEIMHQLGLSSEPEKRIMKELAAQIRSRNYSPDDLKKRYRKLAERIVGLNLRKSSLEVELSGLQGAPKKSRIIKLRQLEIAERLGRMQVLRNALREIIPPDAWKKIEAEIEKALLE